MNADRIVEIADSLVETAGQNAAGASTGERIAAALLINRPEWMGYTLPDGSVDVIAAMDRLGSGGVSEVRLIREYY